MNLLPHNAITLKNIKAQLGIYNDLCLVQGTGTGKSFLFIAIVEQLFPDKSVLYVVPKLAIADNMRKYDEFAIISDQVEFKTYNYFSDADKVKECLDTYDVVVVDECHHLGSEIYGQYLLDLLEEIKEIPDKCFIGLTATPIRSSDNVDVKAFFSTTVLGPDMIDCIEMGIMPPIEYLVCSNEIFEGLKEKNVKEVIDYENSEDFLKSIINDNPKNRWICFFSRIEQLEEQRPLIERLFPKHEIVTVHSDSELSITDIRESGNEKYVILSVDMLLEGVHIPNMEGIILFRNVTSPIVFSQIIGRVCSIGTKASPLVLDCTNTASKLLEKLQRSNSIPRIQGKFREKSDTPAVREITMVSLTNTKYFQLNELWKNILEREFEQRTIASDERLVAEWNFEKNVGLDPERLTMGSNIKVWWRCNKDSRHEWQSTVNERGRGRGCPICAGKIVITGVNDLATSHPELATEWHPTKNGDLKPTEITAGSHKKVWWQCSKDSRHEWEAFVTNRAKGSGCPVCAKGQSIVIQGVNDLATTHPDIASEWHPTKNGDLKPTEVVAGSAKKVWWQCGKDSRHEWETRICGRTKRNGCCPVCSNRKVMTGINDLTTTHPDIAAEWHPTRNGDLKPMEVTAGSNKKVWWQCSKNPRHEWKNLILYRAQGRGCPVCSNRGIMTGINDLATTNPEIAAEWHPTRNGDLKPTEITAGSHKKVWWQCNKDSRHEWDSAILYRAQGGGCPVCSNRKIMTGINDLATTNPEIAAEWHPTKNGDLKPTDVSAGTEKKVWWQCNKDSRHEWEASVSNRAKGSGCLVCQNKLIIVGINDLTTIYPEIAAEWHPIKNGSLKPTDVSFASGKKVWWQCGKDSSHEWETTVQRRANGTGCPICKKKAN